VLNITQKKGLDGNMTNCLKVDKRQKWMDHLFERNHVTTSQQYQRKWMKKIKKKIPKNIQQMEDWTYRKRSQQLSPIQTKHGKESEGKNIWYLDHTSKTIETKSKCIGPNRYSFNSHVRPHRNI
jgi:hypothetical protein